MNTDRPAFIGANAFTWNGLGYRFAQPSPLDLLSETALNHADPWIVLAAVMARAKIGKFDSLPLLFSCMRRSNNLALWRACAELLGDAGPPSVVRQTVDEFRKELFEKRDSDDQRFVCYTLYESRLLWAVPFMLDIYLIAVNRADLQHITFLLSRLLEPIRGQIGSAMLADVAYRELVLGRCQQLREQLGSDQVPILYGELFSVRALAMRLLARLGAGQIDTVQVQYERHAFEAATGVDCSDFWDGVNLRPLTAAATIEDFLASPNAANYEDGVRYFFGHRIPG